MLYTDLAESFRASLQLQHVPVGLAFVEELPATVQHVQVRVPSACTFWRLAEQGVFYANAEDHQECPIGMMTMGFALPASAQQRAGELIETMVNVQYFSPAEVNVLPTVKKPHQYVVYGRLDQFPVAADAVLCLINAQQAMLMAEALGDVNWLQSGQSAFGRPTCAAIPRTLQAESTSVSFGCVGARTYLDMQPGELVITQTAEQFVSLVERIEAIATANVALAPFHRQQKATFGV